MVTPDGETYAFAFARAVDPALYAEVADADVRPENWVLQSVTYPAAAGPNPSVVYHYENPLLRFALTGITDERGIRYAAFGYYADGRVSFTQHAGDVGRTTFAYDDVNLTTTATNPLGKETVYHLEDDGQGRFQVVEVEG